MRKKKEILHYSDGKNHEADSKETLAKLLSQGSNNPFGTLDKEIFKDRLTRMRLDEKGNLANKVGAQSTTRQEELDRRLLYAFNKYKERSLGGVYSSPKDAIEKGSDAYKDIQDLLKF